MRDASPLFVFDRVSELLDNISAIPDPIDRLLALNYAKELSRERIELDRQRAAFDARVSHPLTFISRAADISPQSLRGWAEEYRQRSGDQRRFYAAGPDLSLAQVLD